MTAKNYNVRIRKASWPWRSAMASLVLVMSLIGAIAGSAQSASALSYTGTSPSGTGCDAGANRVGADWSIWVGNKIVAYAGMRYSSKCRSQWEKLTVQDGGYRFILSVWRPNGTDNQGEAMDSGPWVKYTNQIAGIGTYDKVCGGVQVYDQWWHWIKWVDIGCK